MELKDYGINVPTHLQPNSLLWRLLERDEVIINSFLVASSSIQTPYTF
jgi:hypothetical protein